MKFVFLLKAAAVLTSAYHAVGQSVNFITPSLSFSDKAGNLAQDLKFSLTSQPTGPVHLTFTPEQPDDFVVSPCTLIIPADQWNVVQTLKVRALSNPTVMSSRASNIRVVMNRPTANGGRVNNADGSLCFRDESLAVPVTRQFAMKKICYSNGDPHFATFDGESYTIMDAGTNVLLDTAETTITASHYRWGATGPGLNGGIAIRHYDSLVILNMVPQAIVSNGLGTAATFEEIYQPLVKHNGSDSSLIQIQYGLANRGASITLSDKTRIWFSTFRWTGASNSWYMNINIEAPGTYFNRTSGRCGDWNEVVQTNSQVYTFQNGKNVVSSTVNSHLNLFNCPGKTSENPLGTCKSLAKDFANTCNVVPAPSTFCPALSSSPTTTATSSSSSFSSVGVSTSDSSSSPSPTPTTSSSAAVVVISSSAAPSPTPAALAEVGCFKVVSTTKDEVLKLRNDQTKDDIDEYCSNAFRNGALISHPTLSCGTTVENAYSQCTDMKYYETFSLTAATEFAQSIYTQARDSCKAEIESLYPKTNAADRNHALALAVAYKFEIKGCAVAEQPVVINAPADEPIISEEQAAAERNAQIGAGAAAAVVILGAAIGGLAMMMKRKGGYALKNSNDLDVAQFANPLYGDNIKQHENALYENADSTNAVA